MRAPDLPPLSARALEIERHVMGEPPPAPVFPYERKWKRRKQVRKDRLVITRNKIAAGIKAAETRRLAKGTV